ncbi:TPA: hypothetical protein ACP32N_005098 [Pseudomonas aeruginosa]
MKKISDAMRKRIENALGQSGWKFDEDQPHIDTVRCWFYSINLQSGIRLAGMASQDLYRSAVTGKGIIETAIRKHPGVLPADQYLGAVNAFDSSADLKNSDGRGALLAYLAGYARTTKTWQMVPPLSQVPGIHFVAIDWKARDGIHVLRPALCFSDSPLTPDQIVEVASVQLGMHLDRCPREAPIGF